MDLFSVVGLCVIALFFVGGICYSVGYAKGREHGGK